MKKAFGQTVRDIKREVNKKVLKVPSIEQKVLDATSNEPWGPHGTHLADIAQASRNYHDYQMIMSVIWKRINDTGKNWRHVYKALTVLEYLVAHGSERVIDEIREHAYQIQTLSDFQYIDSSGKDQGSNVRKKSQSLVVLANDKDRIQEVRQKAAANKDKYRNASTGGMYRPGSYSSAGGYGERYDDDRYEGRYGSRDEDMNGYGREREWGPRDDDRHGRYGDSYGRDGDRYNRDEDRYSRDGYRDDDYRGRSRSVDDYQYGSRSRSSDRDGDRAYEDDGQYSSRGSGAKPDESQDGSYAGRGLERKYSEQNLGAPPSYEEAVSVGRSPTYSERDGEIPSASAPKSSSPPANVSPNQSANAFLPQQASASPPPPPSVADRKEVDGFDEFDPRGSFSAASPTSNVAAPTTSGSAEMDLLGSLSESFSSNSLALVPTTAFPAASEDVHVNSGSGPSFAVASSSSVSNHTFDDPFGDGQFKAMASTDDLPAQPQNFVSTSSHMTSNQTPEPPQFVEPVNNFGDTYPVVSNVHPSAANMQYSSQEVPTPNQDIDILADILPPTGPQLFSSSETAYTAPIGQPSLPAGFPPQTNFPNQPGQVASLTSFPSQPGQPSMQTSFHVQSGQLVPQTNFLGQTAQSGQPSSVAGFPSQMGSSPQATFLPQSAQQNANFYGGYYPQMGSTGPVAPQMASQVSVGPPTQQNSVNFLSQSGSGAPVPSQLTQSPHVRSSTPMVSQAMVPVSTGSIATAPQPAKDKFETKSTVWADTLSRGLVNLNISGAKTNPLADIGVDFDAINRKEKRMEKPSTAPAVSNVTMGKAMGSGSGIGRAGAGALRPSSNPMMGSGIGVGLGGGPGPGMGMGGYASNNQPMGVGMGMNMPPNMGMGMNMGIGQGAQMQRPMGFPPGSTIPGGYNPMMGMGNYGQQPYGGGYR